MSADIPVPTDIQGKTGAEATWLLASRYPMLWAQFKDHPDVMAVLYAAGSEGGWSTQRFQEALQNTNYWKTHSEQSRAWDTLATIDPAEAQNRMQSGLKAIGDTMGRLGLTANPNDVVGAMGDIYHVVSENLSAAQLADYLTVRYSGDPQLLSNQQNARGEIAANMEKMRAMQSDYGLPTNPANNLWHAQNIARGVETVSAVQGTYAQQAKGLFAPEVGAAIDRGMTVRQWADPYLATASQNLEIGQGSIDLSDPKWQAFLKVPDTSQGAGPGASRVMTQSEWQAHIRTDQTYGFDRTSTARDASAKLSSQLAQTFGAI